MSGFYSNHTTLSLKFTLSEPVIEDFETSHITTGGGSISSSLTSISDTEYKADFTPTGGQGLKTIIVNAGILQDKAGNGNLESDTFEWNCDTTAPTIRITAEDRIVLGT